MGGKTSAASINKYIAKAYDRINLTIPKGEKEDIQAYAIANGESVNGFIGRAIAQAMKPDTDSHAVEPSKKEVAVLSTEPARLSFADYLSWGGINRVELLNGEAVIMAPPSRVHQKISMELCRQLANYLDGKPCEVYAAPFTVRLFEAEGDTAEDVQTVFEPDITVISDKNKLDVYGCKGAPDMVVELLSPSTARHDRLIKLNQYQRAGVLEYWIVSPDEHTIQVYLLHEGQFFLHEVYGNTDLAKVTVLDGCSIDLAKVFHG